MDPLVTVGFVSSFTVMVWGKVVVWPHVSLAVQVLRMELLQSVPLDVSGKLTGLEPSQSSFAVTVAVNDASDRHCRLSVAAGKPLNTGPALSIRVLYVTSA